MEGNHSNNHKLLDDTELHDIENFYINTVLSNKPLYPIGCLKTDIKCMLSDINYLKNEAESQRIRAEAAEQERDKLLQLMHQIENEYAAYVSEAITAYREGSKPDTPPEWENQVEMYLITHPDRDPLQLRVVNNVNLPNNPEFETLVEEWIVDNYGSLDGWEYHRLSHTEIIAIGADTDAPE